jgi:hypothetical protein
MKELEMKDLRNSAGGKGRRAAPDVSVVTRERRVRVKGIGVLFAVFALVLMSGFTLSGCDYISELLWLGGSEDPGEPGKGTGDVSVSFKGVTVGGSGTTTTVSLVFDRDINGLSEADVAVTGGTGAVKGVLVRTGPGTYLLAVSGITEAGEITVTVHKDGWNISPASQTVQASYDEDAVLVTFVGVTADGTAGLQTTTELTLTFDKTIPGLNAGDITLAGINGLTGGALTGPYPAGTYRLGIGGFQAAGTVTVEVNKRGWTISPASQPAEVYYRTPLAEGGTVTDEQVGADSLPIWEIHTFNTVGNHNLVFSPSFNGSVTADYLIVAGGGGAGGLLYDTGQILTPSNGSSQVKVGAGGGGGGAYASGGNGGNSAIGSIEISGGGGDGGCIEARSGAKGGGTGGSGGGGGTGWRYGAAGGGRNTSPTGIKGNVGGAAPSYGAGGGPSTSGGGGGAGSAGGNGILSGSQGYGGTGGNPWYSTDTWIAAVITETSAFSKGGRGGYFVNTTMPSAPTQYYGDGGSGNNGGRRAGGAGYQGIVVIRFQRPATGE